MNKHPDADCGACPLMAEKFVPSAGPDTADVVFVGESPGFQDAAAGKPFTGTSGKLLNSVLTEHKIDRESVFFTNVCLCRPQNNQPLSKLAIKCCSERLKTEINSHQPKVIVSLGAVASSAIMGQSVKITQFRAGPPKQSERYPGVKIIPTVNPAACLRNADLFPSLVTDLAKINTTTASTWTEPKWVGLHDPIQAKQALTELLDNYTDFVIDIETAAEKDTSFERPNHYPILCIGIGFAANRVVVIDKDALQDAGVLQLLKQLIETSNITCHNGKFDLTGLAGIGNGRIAYDTMLSSYALDERSGVHSLKYIATEECGCPDYSSSIKRYTQGAAGSWSKIPSSELHHYNAIDCANTWAIQQLQLEKLAQQPELESLNQFLLEAANMLMQVELGGIKVDTALLNDLEVQYSQSLLDKEKELYQYVDNPRSPKQVTEALAGFGIKVDSTDAKTLQILTEGPAADFCKRLLEYRKEQKLYGTYIKGLNARLFDGRIYTTFSLHTTTTGRLSSRNPNLQNIPRGSTIRNLFVPAEGNVFIQCDYSQIELRVVVTLAQETSLVPILSDPTRDIFGELSAQLFGADWTKVHRQIMKPIVHGTNYGMGPKTMASQINEDARLMGVDLFITVADAGTFQKRYLEMVPNITKWQQATKRELFTEHDDLTTPFGRHRRFWLITEDNKIDVEHEGLAFRPQSIASDICLRAAINLHHVLPDAANIRLLIHDSIMVECPQGTEKITTSIIEHMMIESAQMWTDYIPFSVETKVSTNSWGDLS